MTRVPGTRRNERQAPSLPESSCAHCQGLKVFGAALLLDPVGDGVTLFGYEDRRSLPWNVNGIRAGHGQLLE
jgi:hypothetical protein